MSFHPPSNTITFTAALRDLESTSRKARTRAAHALGDVVEPEQRRRAATALIAVLDDDDTELRAEAALSLGDLELEAAVAPLLAGLDDATALVRQSCAMALGRLGFRAAFAALARALTEGPADLRFQAATSLAEIDPDAAFSPLVAALADENDPEVISSIALALGALGDDRAGPELAAMLDREPALGPPQARFDVAYALAELGNDRAFEVMRQFITDDTLGWDAVEGLVKLGANSSADALAKALANRRTAPPVMLRAAAGLLELAPEHGEAGKARDTLIAGLGARKFEHGAIAVELIGRAGGDWAIAALKSAQGTRRGRRFSAEIDDIVARLERE